jgi:Protein of unknown function (DUF2442)
MASPSTRIAARARAGWQWAQLHREELEANWDFRLRLRFEDGTVGEIDFADRNWRGVFEPLTDPAYFARVRLDPELGTIAWPNGADMAPETLFEHARRNPVEPASKTG